MRALAVLRAVLPPLTLLVACSSGDREPGVSFIHITDPHLFESAKDSETQEKANKRAFERLLATMDALPGSDAEPRFLLLTGDIGFGECETPESTREKRVDALAEILSKKPDLSVYYVPGNNDVTKEKAEGLSEAHSFIADVHKRVRAKGARGVTLRDLTACYDGEPDSTCTADIGTPFRLIGFPTASFKYRREPEKPCDQETQPPTPPNGAEPTAEEKAAADAKAKADAEEKAAADAKVKADAEELHTEWLETLDRLVKAAHDDGKLVLLATHIPDLNDPYHQGKEMLAELLSVAAPQASVDNRPLRWAAWDVPKGLFTKWREIVDGPSVARVLAGHFHDSHREIYRPPYAWEYNPSGEEALRPDRAKIWVAPPLAVRLQTTSPIQARGFALVSLSGRETTRRLYWYDQVKDTFAPEPEGSAAEDGRAAGASGVARWPNLASLDWLWELGDASTDLGKTAVLAIALLVAFLTVVAIWQIPPTTTPLAEPKEGKQAAGGGAQPAPTAPAATTVFTTNFGRTVLSGLGGLAGVAALENLWEDTRLDKLYYVISFVVFFLLLLVLSALLRGLIEALRNRVAARRYEWTSATRGADRRWVGRAWKWVVSLRPTVLVFFDTTLNVLQGKNQLETFVLGQTVLDLQTSLVSTVDRIAEELQRSFRDALEAASHKDSPTPCRINVSVLSRNGSSLSYVSLARGSLLRRFEKHSVAWMAVAAAEKARWWRTSYDAEKVVLYDNTRGELSDFPAKELKLGEYLQAREPRDYEAFVVLPLPWFRGGRVKRRGALHISFAKEKYIDALWQGLCVRERRGVDPRNFYDGDRDLLKLCEPPADSGRPARTNACNPSDDPPSRAGGRDSTPGTEGGSAGASSGAENPETEAAGAASPAGVASKQPPPICIRDRSLQVALAQALAVLPEVLSEFNEDAFEHLVTQRE